MMIFWRLVLAHVIADFTLQTNRVATWKRESRWGMLAHVLTHLVVSLILVWTYLSWTWVQGAGLAINGWSCVVLIAVFHWIQDEWRVWAIRKTASPDSTAFFLWDQVVHLSIILAVSPTIPATGLDRWMIPALCFVVLAHFVSVLIFFVENDRHGESSVLSSQKYRFIAERIFGAALFLLPGLWALLGLLWLAWLVFLHVRDPESRSRVHILVGAFSILLFGLISRVFLFTV